MPSREPTYYRWSQDKPVTTNQTYGFGFAQQGASSPSSGHRHQHSHAAGCDKSASCGSCARPAGDDRFHHQSCEFNRRRSGQLCSRHRPTEKIITPSINRFSPETAVKTINKGYKTGQVPITKKLAATGRSSAPAGVQLQRGATAPPAYEFGESKGQDLYLWHALSGSLVHCKHYEPGDDDQ